MTIAEQIRSDLKDAMRAKDEIALLSLRSILSGFTSELVSSGKTPQDPIDDNLALTVIKREAKKRKDSITQYEQGGRPELADQEKAELAIIEKYLPTMMSKEDIKKIAEKIISEMGEVDKSKIGIIIGQVIKHTAGQADGGDVKATVEELLK